MKLYGPFITKIFKLEPGRGLCQRSKELEETRKYPLIENFKIIYPKFI